MSKGKKPGDRLPTIRAEDDEPIAEFLEIAVLEPLDEQMEAIEQYLTHTVEEMESKHLEKMRRNPTNDWRIEDVIKLCREYGVTCTRPSSGSHYKVSHASQTEILTVPFKRPIKRIYIKKLVAFIDNVRRSK